MAKSAEMILHPKETESERDTVKPLILRPSRLLDILWKSQTKKMAPMRNSHVPKSRDGGWSRK